MADETTNTTDVNTPAPVAAPITDWQKTDSSNPVEVKDTQDTQTLDTELDDFFKWLGLDDSKDADKKTEVKKDEDPFYNPDKKSDIYEKQLETLRSDLKKSTEVANKFKPTQEALEKNPTLQKLVDAVVSWKVTVEWMFKKFAEAQLAKPVSTMKTSTGEAPQMRSQQDRLMGIAAAKRDFENVSSK